MILSGGEDPSTPLHSAQDDNVDNTMFHNSYCAFELRGDFSMRTFHVLSRNDSWGYVDIVEG